MWDTKRHTYRVACHICTTPDSEEAQLLLNADTSVLVFTGRWKVTCGMREIAMHSHDMLFKRQNEVVTVKPMGKPPHAFLALGVWGKIPPQHGVPVTPALFEQLQRRPAYVNNVVFYDEHIQDALNPVVWEMESLGFLETDTETKDELLVKAAYRILRYYYLNVPVCEQGEAPRTLVAQVKEYIDQHLAEDLSAVQLGRISFRSPNYLMAIFREEMGVSLRQYIVQRRIERSIELIRSGVSVTEACYRVGYKSYQGFYKAFRQQTGHEPSVHI